MTLNLDAIANGLMGGSFGTFMVSVVLATVVFDEPHPNSTAYEPAIEMGMSTALTDQHIEVFNDIMLNYMTIVDVLNITKVNEDGSEEPGGLLDLMPSSEPAVGKGTIELRIKTIPNEKMPVFKGDHPEFTPMAYIREETLNGFMRSLLKLSGVYLKTYKLVIGMSVLGALGSIGLGALLIFVDIQRNTKTTVEPIEDDSD